MEYNLLNIIIFILLLVFFVKIILFFVFKIINKTFEKTKNNIDNEIIKVVEKPILVTVFVVILMLFINETKIPASIFF